MCTGEYHCLLLEVLDVRALGQELRHIVNSMPSLLREAVACARENSGANKHRDIREFRNQLLHQGQVLCAIILCRNMNLQECNINVTQVIIVTLGRVTNKQFTLRVVMFQPIFKGSTHEAASNNSNVNHCILFILLFIQIFIYNLLNNAILLIPSYQILILCY